ncbi:MAG TPA: hypothetical protein VJV78_03255 [Polyangiales bacterium]|nr:hypothetical protein [Polyangiales bacterium]
MARPSAHVLLSLLLLAAVGCASTPGAFTPRYGDNDEGQLAVLLERLRAAPKKDQPAVAVGIGAEGSLLYGYDLLERRVLWKQPAKPRFSPIVTGGSVVTQEGDSVIGRDLRTGRLRFSISATGETLVGADGAGSAVLFTLTQGTGTLAKSRVLLMLDSTKRWTRELDAPVGAPALVGEVALVPWNRQYLSGLTVAEGDEFARLRVRDGVISHALARDGTVFAGGEGVLAALTQETIIHGLKKGPHYVPPKEELPGRPEFLRDAYSAPPLAAPDSAQNRIRLVFRPQLTDVQQVTLADGNLYLQFYRFVFALDQKDLGLKWVYAHEVDLVGAASSERGLLLADTRGEILQLSASSGRPVFKERNSLPSMTCEFPSGISLGVGSDSPPTPTEVRQQLTAAAQDADSRLVPVRLLAVKLLAQLNDPEATASLLGLCDDELTTIAVRKAACASLSGRTLGTEYMLTMLMRHASFLEGTTSPPVGALAKAAATQQVKPAVPLLIAHLEDPSTPPQTLSAVVAALGDLGDPSAIEPLNEFLRLYHADPIDEHVTRALELIPTALAKLQGQAARDSLAPIVDDPLGAELVRTRAQKTVAALDEAAKAGEVNPEATQLAAAQAAEQQQAAADPNKPPPPPNYTSNDVVAQALLPVRDQIQACIKGAKPDLFQARLVLMVEDGQVLMVTVTPQQLQGCIEPLVRSQNFPRPQISKRESVSYVIKRF